MAARVLGIVLDDFSSQDDATHLLHTNHSIGARHLPDSVAAFWLPPTDPAQGFSDLVWRHKARQSISRLNTFVISFRKVKQRLSSCIIAPAIARQGSRAMGVSGLPNRFATNALSFGIEVAPGHQAAR
jgi:hypothetical protein